VNHIGDTGCKVVHHLWDQD